MTEAAGLPALFDKALAAARRAVALGKDYVCPVRRKKGRFFFIVSDSPRHGYTVALDDDPVATAQNALYRLAYWGDTGFDTDDVDEFIEQGREL